MKETRHPEFNFWSFYLFLPPIDKGFPFQCKGNWRTSSSCFLHMTGLQWVNLIITLLSRFWYFSPQTNICGFAHKLNGKKLKLYVDRTQSLHFLNSYQPKGHIHIHNHKIFSEDWNIRTLTTMLPSLPGASSLYALYMRCSNYRLDSNLVLYLSFANCLIIRQFIRHLSCVHLLIAL